MVLIGGVAGECPSGGMCRGRRIDAGYRCSARRWGGRCAPGLAWLACSAQQKRLVVPSRAVRGLLLRSAEARSKGKRRACLYSSSTEKGSSREPVSRNIHKPLNSPGPIAPLYDHTGALRVAIAKHLLGLESGVVRFARLLAVAGIEHSHQPPARRLFLV